MPPIRRKIPVGPKGEEKEAELIEVQQSNEYWNQYILSDGSVAKMKIVVTEVWRLVDQWDPEGKPIYVFKSSNILTVNPPDGLMRKL